VFLDGDGSDVPAFIPQIVEPIARGTQISSSARGPAKTRAWQYEFQQFCQGEFAGWILACFIGVRYSDMCPFRAILRDAHGETWMREETTLEFGDAD